MNIFKYSVLLVACFFVSSMQAVIESISVYKNATTGTELCFIGDLHDIKQERDKQQKKVLFHFINQWADADEYTLFLLQASASSFAESKKDFESMGIKLGNHFMIDDLPFLANSYPNKINKKLHFSFSDITGQGIRSMYHIHHCFQGLLPTMTSKIANEPINDIFTLHEFLKKCPNAQKRFFSKDNIRLIEYAIHSSLSTISAQNVLAEIDHKLSIIKAYIKDIDRSDPVAQHLTQLCNNIKQSREKAHSFFLTYLNALSDPAITACTNSIKKDQSFDALIEANTWIKGLTFDVMDAGFLIKILKNQNIFKRIVLFAGSGHIFGLQCLKKMGYKLVFGQGKIRSPKKNIHIVKNTLTPTQLKKLLSNVFTSKATSGASDPQPSTSATLAALKICAACKKQEPKPHEFKKCGQCKKMYYCSRDCQCKDWKARHKEACKKH